MKISFRNKINLLFAFITLGIIVAGFGTYKYNQSVQNTDKEEQHTRQVIYQVAQLLSLTKDIDLSNTAYLACGDSLFLQTMDNAVKIIPASITELANQYKDNPIWIEKIGSLKVLIDKRISISTASLQLFKLKENYLFEQAFNNRNSKLLSDKINNIIQNIQDNEKQLLQTQQESV